MITNHDGITAHMLLMLIHSRLLAMLPGAVIVIVVAFAARLRTVAAAAAGAVDGTKTK